MLGRRTGRAASADEAGEEAASTAKEEPVGAAEGWRRRRLAEVQRYDEVGAEQVEKVQS